MCTQETNKIKPRTMRCFSRRSASTSPSARHVLVSSLSTLCVSLSIPRESRASFSRRKHCSRPGPTSLPRLEGRERSRSSVFS